MDIDINRIGKTYTQSMIEDALGEDWEKELTEIYDWNYTKNGNVHINGLNCWSDYKYVNEKNHKGFACINRVNYDKLTAVLKGSRQVGTLITCAVGLIINMSMNNYIPKLTYPRLYDITNRVFHQSTLEHAKVIETLENLNVIATNESKACMVNPKFGFDVTFDKRGENLRALEELYETFKATGKFTRIW